jgi:ubiquinone/menaquinone biosynthesis C-methylase UbiE/uncharacterized protein YbaR (Trm112 family)
VREALLKILACPVCLSGKVTLQALERNASEVREGQVLCTACGAQLPIRKGVVHTLLASADTVLREAQGWVEMLDIPEKAHEFRDDWILALPFVRPEQTPEAEAVRIWNQVGTHFQENIARVDWRGKRVLEIGAGRCWAVAELARRGAEAVGLDILAHKYLGLETADVWFAAEPQLYFERVVGDMHQLPFQTGVFDYVVTTSSLHHTDRLEEALQSIARVIHEKGHAFFINEPVVPDENSRPDMSDSAEAKYGIQELRPTYPEWVAAFNSAGLFIEEVRFADDMHVLLSKHKQPRRFSAWLHERVRRAPSAPRYYWHKAQRAIKLK